MLSDEVYEQLIKRLTDRIDNVNTYIIKQIGEKIKELSELKPTQANQLVNMMRYGGDYKKIVKELSKITKLNIKDIDEIFDEVAKSDYRFAKQFYEYKEKEYIPFDENRALKSEVEAIKRQTIETYMNLSKTSMLGYGIKDKNGKVHFKTIRKVYEELIDEGVLSISQGHETFSNVLKRIVQSIGESGLRVIYPSGYSRRLDSSVNMNLRDSLNQLHNKEQEIVGEQFGYDGVEITAHERPATDHELLQGRQFSIKEYKKLNEGKRAVAYDGTVIPANPKRRVISTLNCKHTEYSIVLGVSKPEYTEEELQEIIKRNRKGFNYEGKRYTLYEGTQLLRNIELGMRKENDKITFAESTNDPDLENIVKESKDKIKALKKKRKEIMNLMVGGM